MYCLWGGLPPIPNCHAQSEAASEGKAWEPLEVVTQKQGRARCSAQSFTLQLTGLMACTAVM